MPGTCITQVPRSHWFATTILGDYGETIGDGINNVALTSIYRRISNGLVWTPVYSEDEGHNGTSWVDADGVVLQSAAGSGAVVMEPRVDDFRTILPLLLGGPFDGTNVNEIEPPLTSYCQFFKATRGLGLIQQDFLNCKTSQWTLSSSKSQPRLRLNWAIEACGEDRSGDGTAPVLTYNTLPPLVHTSTTFEVDSREIKVDDISLTGDNGLTLDEYNNSTQRQDLPAGRQRFSFTCTSPFVAADLAWLNLGTTSVAAQFVYTSGAYSLTIDMPAIQGVIPTPQSPAGETPVRNEGIVWTARAPATGTAPIKFTLDDIT